jgi:L-lactate dehydrogenase complex protein LldG
VKSAFTKVLAAVRSGLERQAPPSADHRPVSQGLPAAPAIRRAELVSQFASELERVNGHFMGAIAPDEVAAKIIGRINETGARSVAVGGAVVLDLAAILRPLERSGIELVRCGKTSDKERRSLRERLASCDLGVAEADYAIASTGTLVVVATPDRPGALTLLPPVNILLLDAARILPDLAAVVSALGPETITQHRVVFITGPSRTADIEKMIVLGVHGPK